MNKKLNIKPRLQKPIGLGHFAKALEPIGIELAGQEIRELRETRGKASRQKHAYFDFSENAEKIKAAREKIAKLKLRMLGELNDERLAAEAQEILKNKEPFSSLDSARLKDLFLKEFAVPVKRRQLMERIAKEFASRY